MQSGKYEYQSDFARKYYGQGLAEGEQKGRQEGEVTALFEVLDARGIDLPSEARERISACKDLDQLKHWLRRAAMAKSVDELFSQ